jgi:serine/threonine-protein kinase
MELLRGKTLQARMDQGTPSHEEIVAIIAQVCRALSAAHGEGIVHRDMKPENIFLTQRPGGRPVVKVLDFGISKARESTVRDGRITKQGQLLGSPEYMSPEASRGDEVDARADVYAVGIILYELLTGEVPFRHENYLKVLQMHANQRPRSPRELVPDMPETVERLILRALEKDPDQRQASIDELEVELMAAMPEAAHRALLQTATPPPGPWLASTTNPMMFVSGTNPGLAEGSGTAHQAGPPADTTLDTRRGRQRGGLLWGVLLVAVVAAAALGGLRWYQGQRRAPIAAAPAGPIPGAEVGAARPSEAASPREPARAASATDPVAAEPSTPAADPAASADPAAASADPAAASADPAAASVVPAPVAADPAAADPAAATARPGQIRLRIASTPSGAIATLGGRRLGRTPIDEWVDSSDQQAELELDLRGYRAASRSLSLDRDHDLRMTLRHDARRPGGAARRARNPDAGVERPPAADLDIKEGR